MLCVGFFFFFLMWCGLDKPAFGSMLEMTKPLSFALGTHVLKAFIVIFFHVTCEEQVPILTTSSYKSQWCILSQCWKQLLSACMCPWNACHYKAGNQLSLFFFFLFFPSLNKIRSAKTQCEFRDYEYGCESCKWWLFYTVILLHLNGWLLLN